MKLFQAEQIRTIDACSIAKKGIASWELMETAASACTNWLLEKFAGKKFYIVCGTGNNGGDGLVIARLLHLANQQVVVYIVGNPQKGSNDFKINFERISSLPVEVNDSIFFDERRIENNDIIVDAIFGTGLSRPPQGIHAQAIEKINFAQGMKVAIDIPSGLYCEAFHPTHPIVQADYTLSFQFPKLSFLLPETGDFCGKWEILDIGLEPSCIAEQSSREFFFTDDEAVKIFPLRRKTFTHKGNYGHVLVIAGNHLQAGAALLTTKAVLKSGAGLCTLHSVATVGTALFSFFPEGMFSMDEAEEYISQIPDLARYQAVAIGPGLGKHPSTFSVIEHFAAFVKVPSVWDADALNLLSQHPEWKTLLPENSIITPHPKEFDRLFGASSDTWERIEKARMLTTNRNIVVVLKGAYTAVIGNSGCVSFNSTGNPGMATAGSGDVLTGVIAALLGQGLSSWDAARLGVWWHGKAADLAAQKHSKVCLTAGDIIDYLSEVASSMSE